MKSFMSLVVLAVCILAGIYGISQLEFKLSGGEPRQVMGWFDDEHTQPQVEYSVDSDGRFHGDMIQYWPNGNVYTVTSWSHGAAIGPTERFNEDGSPKSAVPEKVVTR